MAQGRLTVWAALLVASASLAAPVAHAGRACRDVDASTSICLIASPEGLPTPKASAICNGGVAVRWSGSEVTVCVTRASGPPPQVTPPYVGAPGATPALGTGGCSRGRGTGFTGILEGEVCLLYYWGPPEHAPHPPREGCSAWFEGDVQEDRLILCPRAEGAVNPPGDVVFGPPSVGSGGDLGAVSCTSGAGGGASIAGNTWSVCVDGNFALEPSEGWSLEPCPDGESGVIWYFGGPFFGVCVA